MHTTTVAVDLAKPFFQLAVADEHRRVIETQRLTRTQFERWFAKRQPMPSIGLLTATAMVAATTGDVSHFKDARHFAGWFGITPREYSPGGSRYLGRIFKKGDRHLGMLLTHGTRSLLRATAVR